MDNTNDFENWLMGALDTEILLCADVSKDKIKKYAVVKDNKNYKRMPIPRGLDAGEGKKGIIL